MKIKKMCVQLSSVSIINYHSMFHSVGEGREGRGEEEVTQDLFQTLYCQSNCSFEKLP